MRRPTLAQRTVRLLAALAVLAVPTLRIAVDAGEEHGPSRVESSHDADRCRVLHDHLACVQLFASAATPAGGGDSLPLPTPPSAPALATVDRVAAATPARPDLPRAPPSLSV